MSIRNEMEMRMHYLARNENVQQNETERQIEEVRNIIHVSGGENVGILAARIAQVHHVLSQGIDQVEACDPRPLDAVCVQNFQTQIQELGDKNSTLKQILADNLTVLKEREQQNVALTQRLSHLEELKQIPLPPGYTERQLCEVGGALAARAARKIKESYYGSRF